MRVQPGSQRAHRHPRGQLGQRRVPATRTREAMAAPLAHPLPAAARGRGVEGLLLSSRSIYIENSGNASRVFRASSPRYYDEQQMVRCNTTITVLLMG
jgi:hypothetical protein